MTQTEFKSIYIMLSRFFFNIHKTNKQKQKEIHRFITFFFVVHVRLFILGSFLQTRIFKIFTLSLNYQVNFFYFGNHNFFQTSPVYL